MKRTCNKCKIEKDISNYHKSARYGHNLICKECVQLKREEVYQAKLNNVEIPKEKTCSKCNTTKPIEEFKKRKSSKDLHSNSCKTCEREYMDGYRKENEEYLREQRKEYYSKPETIERLEEQKEEMKEYQKEYNKQKNLDIKNDPEKREERNKYVREYRKKQRALGIEKEKVREKRKNDPHYKFSKNFKANLKKGFRLYSKNGKTDSCKNYGIDIAAIIEKIGYCPSKNHHLDHIIPKILFDFDNKRHVYLCNHQENLRWIDGSENSSKKDCVCWDLIEGNAFLESIALEIGISKEEDGIYGSEIRTRLYGN